MPEIDYSTLTIKTTKTGGAVMTENINNNLINPKPNTRFMRCICEDDLSYVDVPIPGGTTIDFREMVLSSAGELSGVHSRKPFGSGRKTFHYYFCFGPLFGKDYGDGIHEDVACGMWNTKIIRVDILTNKIL